MWHCPWYSLYPPHFSWMTLGFVALYSKGLPWCLSGRESACQCRRHRFGPWVRKTPWRKKWQPTLIFLPGKSHGQRSLVGYSPWGRIESDATEWLNNNGMGMLFFIHVLWTVREVNDVSIRNQRIIPWQSTLFSKDSASIYWMSFCVSGARETEDCSSREKRTSFEQYTTGIGSPPSPLPRICTVTKWYEMKTSTRSL